MFFLSLLGVPTFLRLSKDKILLPWVWIYLDISVKVVPSLIYHITALVLFQASWLYWYKKVLKLQVQLVLLCFKFYYTFIVWNSHNYCSYTFAFCKEFAEFLKAFIHYNFLNLLKHIFMKYMYMTYEKSNESSWIFCSYIKKHHGNALGNMLSKKPWNFSFSFPVFPKV